MSNIEETKAQIKELESQLKKLYQKTFEENLPKLWEMLDPKIIGFRYAQFTPYWNDGDTCEFGANYDYPTFIFADRSELSAYGDYDKYNLYSKNCFKVRDFMETFSNDYLKSAFGDHAQVTIYRDGKVEIDSYDHE